MRLRFGTASRLSRDDLPFGLYERLITASLKSRLLPFDPSWALVRKAGLDAAEAAATLARHIEEIVARLPSTAGPDDSGLYGARLLGSPNGRPHRVPLGPTT